MLAEIKNDGPYLGLPIIRLKTQDARPHHYPSPAEQFDTTRVHTFLATEEFSELENLLAFEFGSIRF